MARFDPKKFDFKKSEADYLVQLSKFTTDDVAKDIESWRRELQTLRKEFDKNRTQIAKDTAAALQQMQLADKLNASVEKKGKTAGDLIRNIQKSDRKVGTAMAKKLQGLTIQILNLRILAVGATKAASVRLGPPAKLSPPKHIPSMGKISSILWR